MRAKISDCSRVGAATIAIWLCATNGGAQDESEEPAAPPSEEVSKAAEEESVATPKPTEVYRSQFDKSVDVDRWSPTRIGKAPNGRRFLGEYALMDSAILNVRDLPEHKFIRLRADLLVLKSWDGFTKDLRPDSWSIQEVDGPLLLVTTFCNPMTRLGVEDAAPAAGPERKRYQSFPDEYPGARHDPGTGSTGGGEKLGFKFRDDLEATETIYKIDLVFPHSAKDLALRFVGRLSHKKDDESWALDNVIVDAIDRETTPDEKQLEVLWSKLNGRDPVAANGALWEIIAAGKKGQQFAWRRWQEYGAEQEKKAAPKLAALRAKIGGLLVGLADEDFADRQRAQSDLYKLDVDALDVLIELSEKEKDPEIRGAMVKAIERLNKRKAAMPVDVHESVVRSRVKHIVRIFETRENGYRISSSPLKKPEHAYDSLGAVADGYVPTASNLGAVPRYTWFPKRGTSEWLQFDFPKPKTISMAEAYWYVAIKAGSTSLPKSWQVQYQDAGGDWKPVEHEGDYPLAADKFNTVRFKPVTTGAVRLAVQLNAGRSGGIHEFRVTNPKATDR